MCFLRAMNGMIVSIIALGLRHARVHSWGVSDRPSVSTMKARSADRASSTMLMSLAVESKEHVQQKAPAYAGAFRFNQG